MATLAQMIANRTNASSRQSVRPYPHDAQTQISTSGQGPATVEGKSRSARNSITSGLFSAGDFIAPGEHETYAEFCAAYQADLSPEGAVEHTLAAEIVHAAWRLRRCSTLEAATTEFDERTQQSIDRARTSAFRIYTRSLHEFRKIQTERPAPAEPVVDEAAIAVSAKRTQSEPLSTPRGAPCTCGSGIKFKRCCGKGAPPVLNLAA